MRSVSQLTDRSFRWSDSLSAALFRWLFESDPPIALQVFWKLLLFTLAALMWFEVAPTVHSLAGQLALYIWGSFWALLALFTKSGDG